MKIKLEFKPKLFFVGALREKKDCNSRPWAHVWETHIWICLIPCFPIHIIHKKLKIFGNY